jgi:hypothetical protein
MALTPFVSFEPQTQRVTIKALSVRECVRLHAARPREGPGARDNSALAATLPSAACGGPCCICLLADASERATLPCGHVMHRGCLALWLKRAAGCPLCRAPVDAWRAERMRQDEEYERALAADLLALSPDLAEVRRVRLLRFEAASTCASALSQPD